MTARLTGRQAGSGRLRRSAPMQHWRRDSPATWCGCWSEGEHVMSSMKEAADRLTEARAW